jgi:hypothetical protein
MTTSENIALLRQYTIESNIIELDKLFSGFQSDDIIEYNLLEYINYVFKMAFRYVKQSVAEWLISRYRIYIHDLSRNVFLYPFLHYISSRNAIIRKSYKLFTPDSPEYRLLDWYFSSNFVYDINSLKRLTLKLGVTNNYDLLQLVISKTYVTIDNSDFGIMCEYGALDCARLVLDTYHFLDIRDDDHYAFYWAATLNRVHVTIWLASKYPDIYHYRISDDGKNIKAFYYFKNYPEDGESLIQANMNDISSKFITACVKNKLDFIKLYHELLGDFDILPHHTKISGIHRLIDNNSNDAVFYIIDNLKSIGTSLKTRILTYSIGLSNFDIAHKILSVENGENGQYYTPLDYKYLVTNLSITNIRAHGYSIIKYLKQIVPLKTDMCSVFEAAFISGQYNLAQYIFESCYVNLDDRLKCVSLFRSAVVVKGPDSIKFLLDVIKLDEYFKLEFRKICYYAGGCGNLENLLWLIEYSESRDDIIKPNINKCFKALCSSRILTSVQYFYKMYSDKIVLNPPEFEQSPLKNAIDSISPDVCKWLYSLYAYDLTINNDQVFRDVVHENRYYLDDIVAMLRWLHELYPDRYDLVINRRGEIRYWNIRNLLSIIGTLCIDQSEVETCSICYCADSEVITVPCKHMYCGSCIQRWYNTNTSCPFCRTNICGVLKLIYHGDSTISL